MQKNVLLSGLIIIVIVVAGIGYYAFRPESTEQISQPTPTVSLNATEAPVKTFTVTAKNFSFSPSEIRVSEGDRVKIILNVEQGFHDWVVDEFNARTPQVQAPSTMEVEFVADQAGTFEFYCSVGTHRQMGMVGNLIVE